MTAKSRNSVTNRSSCFMQWRGKNFPLQRINAQEERIHRSDVFYAVQAKAVQRRSTAESHSIGERHGDSISKGQQPRRSAHT